MFDKGKLTLDQTEFNVQNRALKKSSISLDNLDKRNSSGIKVRDTFIEVNKTLLFQNTQNLKANRTRNELLDVRHQSILNNFKIVNTNIVDNFDLLQTGLIKGKFGNKKLHSTIMLEGMTKTLTSMQQQLNFIQSELQQFQEDELFDVDIGKKRRRGGVRGTRSTKPSVLNKLKNIVKPTPKTITSNNSKLAQNSKLKVPNAPVKPNSTIKPASISKTTPNLSKAIVKPNAINTPLKSPSLTVPNTINPIGASARGGSSLLGTVGRGVTRAALPIAAGLTMYEAYDAYKQGDMKKVTEAVSGGIGGIAGGALAGAAIGSVVPVVGTAVGGIVGGGLGYLAGTKLGSSIYDWWNKDDEKQEIKKKEIKKDSNNDEVKKAVENTSTKIKDMSGVIASSSTELTKKIIEGNSSLSLIQKDIEKVTNPTFGLASSGAIGVVANSWLAIQAFLGMKTDEEKLKESRELAKIPSTPPIDRNAPLLGKDFRLPVPKGIDTKYKSPSYTPTTLNNIDKTRKSSGSKPITTKGGSSSQSSTPLGKDFSVQIDKNAASALGKYANVSGADVSGLNADLKSRFGSAAKDYYEATGRKIKVTSAYRSQEKQAQLWVRANVYQEPGIYGPAKPSKPTEITWKGKKHNVPGSGKKPSKHFTGQALDISVNSGDAAAFVPYAAKYGLGRPFSWDPPHYEIIDGSAPIGNFDGTNDETNGKITNIKEPETPSLVASTGIGTGIGTGTGTLVPTTVETPIIGDSSILSSENTKSGTQNVTDVIGVSKQIDSKEINISKSTGIDNKAPTLPTLSTSPILTGMQQSKPPINMRKTPRIKPTIISSTGDGNLDLPTYVNDPSIQAYRIDPTRPIEG